MKAKFSMLQPAWLSLRHRIRRSIGLSGALGILLMAFALLAALPPASGWRAETQELSRRTQRLQHEFERDRILLQLSPNLDEQIKNFTAWFPDMRRNADDLRLVAEQAGKAKLELDKGEYRLTRAAGSSFVNYEVVLPVKGDYAGVRGFIAGVLNAVPHASLSELRMERPSAGSDMLDARVHFTFVYRGA